MSIFLLVITDGRRECLQQTMMSAEVMLRGEISGGVIVDDSSDPRYRGWLRDTWPQYSVVGGLTKLGFGGAIRLGWRSIGDCSHVFHLEDDFVFNVAVDLDPMVSILRDAPEITQLVLKRQSWSDTERAAGGIVECWPHLYEEVETVHGWYTRHRLFFSTNPSLYRRDLIDVGWPEGERSERTFTDRILGDPNKYFAFLGRKFDPPLVQHIGHERVGTGY